MKLEFVFKVVMTFFTCMRVSWADMQHPFGKDEFLVKIIRKNDLAKFEANTNLTNSTFLHHQVAERKIVILSIIGAYREGKSFFLDYCLRYLYATYGSVNTVESKKIGVEDWLGKGDEPLSGFSWAHGSTAHTKGLMMWNDVFLYDAPNGEKLAIFIIDTQGLFEKGSPGDENAKIFSFGTLVSSIQIINIKETIKENQIDSLKTAIDLTNLITTKQKGNQTKTKAFQNLVFLLRDYEDAKYGYGFEGGERYFEDFFSTEANEGTKANVSRDGIRQSFEKISCFLLEHPGLIVKKENFKGQWGKLEQNFVKNLKVLIESLLAPQHLVKKTVLGTEITSAQFKDYFLALTESYSNYETPELNNLFQVAVDNQMIALIKDKIKNYKKEFNEDLIDYDQNDFVEWLKQKHEHAKNRVIDEFMSADKIDDKVSEEKFKILLEEEVEEVFNTLQKQIMESYWLAVENRMSSIVADQLSEYQTKIKKNVRYEQENFKELIDEKHENLKNQLILNFHLLTKKYKSTEKEELFNAKLIKSIDEYYETWRKSAISHHEEKKLKKFMEVIMKSYRENLDKSVDLNQDNFESNMEKNHKRFRLEALNNYSKFVTALSNTQVMDKYKRELEEEIDSHYKTWSVKKLKDYDEFINQKRTAEKREIKIFVLEQGNIFETKMNQISYKDPDYAREDFLTNMNDQLKNEKNNSMHNFSLNTNKYKDSVILEEINKQEENLGRNLNTIFLKWKDMHVKDHSEYLNKISLLMDAIILEKRKSYEDAMEKFDLGANSFHDEFEKIDDNAKNSAVSDFNNRTISMKQSKVSEKKKKLLENLENASSKSKEEKKAAYEKIRNDGIWVQWNAGKNYLPPHAVIGGHLNGYDCAVAQFGDYTGDFCLYTGAAAAGDGYNTHTRYDFEILLHVKSRWVNHSEGKTLYSKGRPICRDVGSLGTQRHMGSIYRHLSRNFCYSYSRDKGKYNTEWSIIMEQPQFIQTFSKASYQRIKL